APPPAPKYAGPRRPALAGFEVGMFPAAKKLGKAPPAVAAEVAAGFAPTELLAGATATGPFVNFTVNRAAAFRWTIARAMAGDLVPRQHGAGKTITIDYS